MAPLYLYNSLSGEKELFQPLQPPRVGIYVCGVTVYDYCHVGHARVMVVFDIIVRYLRALGYEVQYVRNITDLDDKIFQRAAENNEPFTELTARFITAMHEDEAALNVLPPDREPRATGYMEAILSMVRILMEKGYAYLGENNDIYYQVDKFAGYGKLSKQSLEDLLAGARIEIGSAKHNAQDFVLWKAAKAGEAAWESPWGPGRPGWHIECSAMSTSCLGATFDIHGGGPDLKFPHHENEIAQSEAATGKPYVKVWMHAGAVRIDNEKMSKSLGNFFTIREVLRKYNPEVLRYFLLASHYRSAINYSEDSLKQAHQALERLYLALRNIPAGQFQGGEASGLASAYEERFHAAMCDDFNTPEALAVLFEITKKANTDKALSGQFVVLLRKLGAVLGLLQQEPGTFLQQAVQAELTPEVIENLIAARTQARQEKNWARADAIRDELAAGGIQLDDRDNKTQWRRGS